LNEEIEIAIQPNVIGFERFMKEVMIQTNCALEEESHSQTVVGVVVKSIIGL
jgi:hypothetical protein